MEVNEYNIPVPWGHVAVKAWGNKTDTPVLVTHGIQDNAGIFDRILPLLPKCFYYMCIDLPSHGRSSPFPTKMFVSPMDNVVAYKIILDYLDRKKYILMGHSWGAHAFVLFAQLYPEYVLKLCLIDGIYPFPLSHKLYKSYWKMRIGGLIKINDHVSNNRQPTYTYEEALNKLIANRMFGGITKPTAECLLKRSLIPAENGKFTFSMDPRLKVFLLAPFGLEYMLQIFQNCPIECPLLLLTASQSQVDVWSTLKPILDELQKNAKCEIRELQGNHDDFSNDPEPWANCIAEFLCKEYSKL